MIDRINGRLSLLLAVLLVLVVVLLGWFAFVAPQRSKAATLDARIGDANVTLASTQAFLSSPAAHQSARDLRRVSRALPDDVKMSEILGSLPGRPARAASRSTASRRRRPFRLPERKPFRSPSR